VPSALDHVRALCLLVVHPMKYVESVAIGCATICFDKIWLSDNRRIEVVQAGRGARRAVVVIGEMDAPNGAGSSAPQVSRL
jgi:hypothetical protein